MCHVSPFERRKLAVLVINHLAMNLFSVTLSATRKSLYTTTLVVALVGVLLPWSVLLYLRFYHTLVPNASYTLPLKVRHQQEVYAVANGLVDVLARQQEQAQGELNYDLVLSLKVYCPKLLLGDTKLVFGHLVWDDGSTSAEHAPSSFLVHCDPRMIFNSYNWFVPYNLRLWVFPFLTHNERLNRVQVSVANMGGSDLLRRLTAGGPHNPRNRKSPTTISYKVDYPLLVDPEQSSLSVNVEWRGIRYYLFYHYYFCFVCGVALFWGTSSGVCLAVSLVVWYMVRSKALSSTLTQFTELAKRKQY